MNLIFGMRRKYFFRKPSFANGLLRPLLILLVAGSFIGLAGCNTKNSYYTRGIGIYPGAVNQTFSPARSIDRSTYRNLALQRPAFHSSSYDCNLTAQLITDGIRPDTLPALFAASTSQQGVLNKNEREWMIDFNRVATISIDNAGGRGWVQPERQGEGGVPVIDSVYVIADAWIDDKKPKGWSLQLLRSGQGLEGVSFAPSHSFISAWKSGGNGVEWVYVDLGAVCEFDSLALHWIKGAIKGSIQVSYDALTWRDIIHLSGAGEYSLDTPQEGRYVRILMEEPASGDGYILSEVEVFGKGGPVYIPAARAKSVKDDMVPLAGGHGSC